jgi:hypothetical protein
MKTIKKYLSGVLFIVLAMTLLSFDLPKGWYIAGSAPKSYDMGIDKGAGPDGDNAATIKSIDAKIDGFGTLLQNCLPDHYLGERVRMSGMLKSKDVVEWSSFWFRIDQQGLDKALSFDNMHDGKIDRSVKGTTDWTKSEIVLDVPNNASKLAYGALLVGTGQIWFDNIHFEIVDNTVPVTGGLTESMLTEKEPVNLDFEN